MLEQAGRPLGNKSIGQVEACASEMLCMPPLQQTATA